MTATTTNRILNTIYDTDTPIYYQISDLIDAYLNHSGNNIFAMISTAGNINKIDQGIINKHTIEYVPGGTRYVTISVYIPEQYGAVQKFVQTHISYESFGGTIMIDGILYRVSLGILPTTTDIKPLRIINHNVTVTDIDYEDPEYRQYCLIQYVESEIPLKVKFEDLESLTVPGVDITIGPNPQRYIEFVQDYTKYDISHLDLNSGIAFAYKFAFAVIGSTLYIIYRRREDPYDSDCEIDIATYRTKYSNIQSLKIASIPHITPVYLMIKFTSNQILFVDVGKMIPNKVNRTAYS